MTNKFFLLTRDGDNIEIPVLFDTLEAARDAMKLSLIYAMRGSDESIIDEHIIDEEYDWAPDCDEAWFNGDHGNYDWKIVSFAEIEAHSAKWGIEL